MLSVAADGAGLRSASAILGEDVACEVHLREFPLIVTPLDLRLGRDAGAVAAWFAFYRDRIELALAEYGAILFRDFAIHTTADFAATVEIYPAPPGGYSGGATPRNAISGRVFEATRTAANIRLMQHQEMAYLPRWPRKVAFWCNRASETGGETIMTSIRRFEPTIDGKLHAAVAERGLLYTRNFRGSGAFPKVLESFHRTWQDAFYTDDPAIAERSLAEMGMASRWENDGSLTALYRSEGFVRHSVTGNRHWFNQLASQTFTPLSIPDEWPAYAAHYGDGRPQPYDVRFGDGAKIPLDDVIALFPPMDAATVALPWRHGDLLMLDNVLTAHGRNPYTGHRDVQVALLENGGLQ